MKRFTTWTIGILILCAAAAYSEGRLTYNAVESPLGGQAKFVYTSFIDDADHSNQKEIVPFQNTSSAPVPNGNHLFSTNTSVVDGLNLIVSRAGGRIRGDMLSVRLSNHNPGATSNCDYKVMKWTAVPFPVVDLTSRDPTTSWTQCTGIVRVGTLGGNAGGVGDQTVASRSDGYAVPLGSCECDDPECILVVVGTDRDATSLCTVVADTIITLFGTELF